MSEGKRYAPSNGLTDDKLRKVGKIVAAHAIERVEVGDIVGVVQETAKAARLAQDILIELDLLVPEGEEGA